MCQQVLDWCTSCPGKDSSLYQVGREVPPAQWTTWCGC